MNNQMSAVMQRRGELLARIAAQREQVAGIGTRWRWQIKGYLSYVFCVPIRCCSPVWSR